ncbi:MAG: hypothetical protein AB1510_11955 [Bacillota bacterium]
MPISGYLPVDNAINHSEWGKLAERTVRYLESCRVADGGYYFARITPGSPHDTFYAVAALQLLGVGPVKPDGVVEFFQGLLRREALQTPAAVFFTVSSLALLGRLDSKWSVLGKKLQRIQDPEGGFWIPKYLWVEAASRLTNTYYAVGALTRLNMPFRREECARLVARELNSVLATGELDSLATVYYGIEILTLLEQPFPVETDIILPYLENVSGEAGFLEHWYYVTAIYRHLGKTPRFFKKVVDFTLGCERTRGGFARSPSPCAISTVIYTFYAVEIMQALGLLKKIYW